MKKCIRLGKLCNEGKSGHVKMNKVTINFKTIPNYIEELNRILERKEIIKAQRLLIRNNSQEKDIDGVGNKDDDSIEKENNDNKD